MTTLPGAPVFTALLIASRRACLARGATTYRLDPVDGDDWNPAGKPRKTFGKLNATQQWRFPAFWAGGDTWTVRFAPPVTGDYSFHANGYNNLGPQTESLMVFANLGIEGQPLPAGEGSEVAQLCKLCASRGPPLTPARSYPASPPHPVAMWLESITTLQSDVFFLPCSPADITAPEPTHGVSPMKQGPARSFHHAEARHHDPGTNHGFHHDTTPRDDESAAKLAWQRTLEFFNKKLTRGSLTRGSLSSEF